MKNFSELNLNQHWYLYSLDSVEVQKALQYKMSYDIEKFGDDVYSKLRHHHFLMVSKLAEVADELKSRGVDFGELSILREKL